MLLPVDCRMQSIISVLENSVYREIVGCCAYNKIYLKYMDSRKNFAIEYGHPIVNLKRYGFLITEKHYLHSEKQSFINDLKLSQGAVIQHSYSSLLLRMRLIKTGLPIDIPHMIYTKEVNIKNEQLVMKTSDEKFKLMSWNHLFSRENEKISVYFVMQKPEKHLDIDEILAEFSKSCALYPHYNTPDIHQKIQNDITEDMLINKSSAAIPLWNRNIWKMHITRGWFSLFAYEVLKNNYLQTKMLALSQSYHDLSVSINQMAIKEKNFNLTPHITQLMENLNEESRIISEISR
ncbi:hypothetical protein [Erwinia oleae]|uniref:hypothetical protein n=1 Tax=Erwinia oleae TaxID=796334 RepID=UPI00054F4B81|nr:hypothetical protein [Erwinia oleae]